MKKKLKLLFKTFSYIEEEVLIGAGVALWLLIAVLLTINCPLLNEEEFSFGLFVSDFLAWNILISFVIGCIIIIVLLIKGIIYVFKDIFNSYLLAKRELEEEIEEAET